MLDTTRSISTPEGIELTLRLAGPVPRAIAWVIDLAIRAAILFAASLALTILYKAGYAVYLLAAFLLEWLYPVFFEVYWGGTTPGKRWLGIMVLNDDGTPVRWPASLTRNLLRTVDFLPTLYFLGFIAMVLNRDFKRLGDVAADTLVVYRDARIVEPDIPRAIPIAPPVSLSIDDQRAVLDFAERAGKLTEERAGELAEIARSLAGNAAGKQGVARLIGIANHLLGRT
ncbi:MAG: RDD family protein [Burkholderiales bacterium]